MPSAKGPIEKLFVNLRNALSRVKVRWYVFGAQAAIVYGSNRLTSDVDVTLDLHETSVAELLKALAKHGFEPQIPDRRFIEVTRVIPVVHVKTELPVENSSSSNPGTRGSVILCWLGPDWKTSSSSAL